MHVTLLTLNERLTPVDHQTHRCYDFQVPSDCEELRVHVSYTPKYASFEESQALSAAALRRQRADLAQRLGDALAASWTADQAAAAERAAVPNLLTISLDDAVGAYRGAAHRHAPDQSLVLGLDAATPGLVRGPLPGGTWTLTLSAHTLVSPHVDVAIQIGAEMAASPP
jgi:hypothetical protein